MRHEPNVMLVHFSDMKRDLPGRTGTESLKAALEMLGFGRCDHAFEMIARACHVRHWKALARGEQPDYDDLFRGFQSAVDFPWR